MLHKHVPIYVQFMNMGLKISIPLILEFQMIDFHGNLIHDAHIFLYSSFLISGSV